MGHSQSRVEEENQVSSRTSSSDESDNVSYESETNSSGRSTTSTVHSETSYGSTVVDQPKQQSQFNDDIESTQIKTHLCCRKCECYCDCGRDCTDNCCYRCMKSTFCCFITFLWTVIKYFIVFCIYLIITCIIICCPPLWILCICSRGSRGILRLACWSRLLGAGGEWFLFCALDLLS